MTYLEGGLNECCIIVYITCRNFKYLNTSNTHESWIISWRKRNIKKNKHNNYMIRNDLTSTINDELNKSNVVQ